jgi:acetyltransferase-like isoleucine patch superfamily enzyme
MKRALKILTASPLAGLLRLCRPLRTNLQRIYAHAALSADLSTRLPASTVVLGKVTVYGTGNIEFGENVLLYPDVHLETQDGASIRIGNACVIARGVHIVAMAGVEIGSETLIGEYAGIRDANHRRSEDASIRASGHTAKPIHIGSQVWIGRAVTVLGGVKIGDEATIGANAVVTRDVSAKTVAVGVPATRVASQKSAH